MTKNPTFFVKMWSGNKALLRVLLVVVMLGLTVKGAVALTTSNYIGYWASDINGNFIDSSGNGHTGTVSVASYINNGFINGAYNYTTNDAYVEIPNAANLTGYTQFSFGMWFRSNETFQNDYALFGKNAAGDYQFDVSEVVTNNNLMCNLRHATTGTPDYRAISTTGGFNDGAWHLVICNIDYSGGNVSIYVDNVLEGTDTVSSSTYNVNGARPIRIGQREGFKGMKGNLDEVFYINKTLNNTELSEIWNSGAGYNPFYNPFLANFSITAVNAWNASSISSFSALINGTYYHTTNGTINTGLPSNSTSLYDIKLNSSGYADRTYEDYNISSDLSAELYPENSVEVFAFDLSGDVIVNFTSFLSNYSVMYSNDSVNNVSRFSGVLAGDYKIIVSASGYGFAEYVITIGESSHQFVYAYLANSSSNNFTFTTQDASTNSILEDVVITQNVFINGSIVTLESKMSDITGRAQFSYASGVEYYFIASKNGFVSREFPLTVLFDNYFLPLDQVSSYNSSVFFDDVSRSIVGYDFSNSSSWFAINFYSPRGSLEYYNVNVTTDSNSSFVQGFSVSGGLLNASMNTTSASYGDVATVVVSYKSSLNSGVVTLTYNYMFTTWNAGAGSLDYLVAELISYSDFSKGFWASLFIVLVMGLFTIVGAFAGESVLVGAVGGVIASVIVGVLGLVNWVVMGLVLFVLSILIVGRLMQSG